MKHKMTELDEKNFEMTKKKCVRARLRLVHRCRVPNSCIQPIFRPEISHRGIGADGWGMGRDSASSTQSKRA
jgi:hypothetical protein